MVQLTLSQSQMVERLLSNSFAMSRAPKGHEGRYMAIFTMSYSLAHILSAKIGMNLIEYFGYQTNWLIMGILCIIGTLLGVWVFKKVDEEKNLKIS